MTPTCYCQTCRVPVPAPDVTMTTDPQGRVIVTAVHHHATIAVEIPAPLKTATAVKIGLFPLKVHG